MLEKIVVLSGRIGSGKSTLAQKLAKQHSARVVKTHELIKTYYPEANSRDAYQTAGENLDIKEDGKWVCDQIVRLAASEIPEETKILILDSVRIKKQIAHLRKAFGSKVFHVHFTASESELEARFKKREKPFEEAKTYAETQQNETENAVESLAEYADIVIHTDRCDEEDVLVRTCAHLHLFPRANTALVDVILGGQYGSEGKGHIASYIASEYEYLVRVGGPNAGHKVFRGEDGAVTFRHLPSGSLNAPNAKIILGPGTIISLDVLLDEISRNKIDIDRLRIDPNAILITPENIQYEIDNFGTIASTAQGVGAAAAGRILGRKDPTPTKFVTSAKELAPYIESTRKVLETAYNNESKVLLEGTQGSALSIFHGLYPFVTSRDTNVAGCLSEAGIPPTRVRKVIMVCRTYPIRVGGPSGPMKQQLELKDIAARAQWELADIEKIEVGSVTKRQRRIGEFDWALLRQSCLLNAPTDIALTFTDYIDKKNDGARRFEQLTPETIRFIEEIEKVSRAPVSLISTRFDYRSIIDKRNW